MDQDLKAEKFLFIGKEKDLRRSLHLPTTNPGNFVLVAP
jgi:hypothetical protein